MATYTDNANRANETPVAAPWAHSTGTVGQARIVSNVFKENAAVDPCHFYYNASVGQSQRSSFTLTAEIETGGTFDQGGGPKVFCQAANRAGYAAVAKSTGLTIVRFLADGTPQNVASYAGAFAAGQTVELIGEVVGATIELEAFQNGVSRATYTDPSPLNTTGFVGGYFSGFNAVVELDNFDG